MWCLKGQRVRVQVTGIDERGRINLSMVFDEKAIMRALKMQIKIDFC